MWAVLLDVAECLWQLNVAGSWRTLCHGCVGCRWVFWADERVVPHDSADSNYRGAREEFLSKVPIPQEQASHTTTFGSSKLIALLGVQCCTDMLSGMCVCPHHCPSAMNIFPLSIPPGSDPTLVTLLST